MNKTIILIIAILMVILGIYFVFFSNNAQAPEKAENVTPPAQEKQEEMMMNENTMKYVLVSDQSELAWEASRLASKPHLGKVDISEGYLLKEDDTYTGGNFVIDMQSISEDENNERFLQHIASDDFFKVEEYPTSTLKLKSITSSGENTYDVIADLTILDTTNEVSFPAEIMKDDEQLEIQAAFEIDRTKWNIIYGSGNFFKELGDKAIKDNISYNLTLILEKES